MVLEVEVVKGQDFTYFALMMAKIPRVQSVEMGYDSYASPITDR